MKKNFIILLLVFLSLDMGADNLRHHIRIHQTGQMPNHSEYYPPADMPEVYYNSDNLEIIIVADGFADYYDVNIVSQSTQLAVILTQVDGYGDTIDVSSLPDDNYTIIITSSNNKLNYKLINQRL